MTNTLHLKRSQYQIMVLKLPSSLKIFMCWLLDDCAFASANDSTSVPIGKLRKCLSLAECIVSVRKNKFIYFHLGLALQIFWFFGCSTFHRCSTQKSCGYTWELYLVVMKVGDISQFTICVVRFLISHVRFYPPFTLLLDLTFFRIGKKYVYKILKTSSEELSDLVSLTNADLETTINAARHVVYLLCDIKGKFSRVIMMLTCCGSN